MSKIIDKIINKVAQIAENSVDMNPEVYSPFYFGEEISLEKCTRKK